MDTPMVAQYRELKRQYPGTLLFFRLGDFYELFFEDAIVAARELEITLTARHKERGQNPIPMCGVPHLSGAPHIAKLVRKGYRVAICEQMDAAGAKKLVRREVVRIITPGTAVDPQLLEQRQSVYLGAVSGSGDALGAAFLDLSTGEFRVTQIAGSDAWARIRSVIEAYAPRELLFPASLSNLIHQGDDRTALPLNATNESAEPEGHAKSAGPAVAPVFFGETIALTPLDDWLWQVDTCASLLCEHFGVKTLEPFGLEGKYDAVRAAGACLRYAKETQRSAAAHVNRVEFFASQDHLILDPVTVRNLDLVDSPHGAARNYSLLGVIDATATSMGARALRSWLLRPSVKRGEIEARHGAIEDLYGAQQVRDRLRSSLKDVADLERLIGRLNMNTANPRDLVAIGRSLRQVPIIRRTLSDAKSTLLRVLCEAADELEDVQTLVARALSDDPPQNIGDGDVIRAGYNAELDELRHTNRNAKQLIAALEARERTRSGIASLRVRYNGVFGYFIEVSKANSARVPRDYERRQTLVNAERFSTPELKKLETDVLGAEDRIRELETQFFQEVKSSIAAETKRLMGTARSIATLDALVALAEVAARHRYVRPQMHDSDELEIVAARHPIIEAREDAPFIPNDIYLNNSTDRLLIITGPNMGGKSTILKQTALICLMAQMGSFVPAERARLPVLDRIWTRVGASDDLSRARSTFMVEMVETAAILHNATPRSLVLLDEIGRGTATFDGLSIAWAVAEHLHDSPQHAAKTLFATHYHELTELAERLPGAQNYYITVAERDGELAFLYRLERGCASKSYGIEVARLAGLPTSVVARARDVLARLERYELDVFAEQAIDAEEDRQAATAAAGDAVIERVAKRRARRTLAAQATLFDLANQNLLEELQKMEPNALSETEAKAFLQHLQRRVV